MSRADTAPEPAMRRPGRAILGLALGAALLPVLSAAQPVGDGLDVGGFKAYPWLDVIFEYRDNYYRSSSKAEAFGVRGPMGTWVNILEPGLRLSALKGTDAYSLSYLARLGTVFAQQSDDFVDQRVAANGSWELGLRHRLRADYEFLHWHDPPGSGEPQDVTRPNFFQSPDRWDSNRAMLEYSFGAPGAKGRLDLRAAALARRYTNNDQESRDNDRGILGATFYARVLPKLSLLTLLDWEGIDYIRQDPGTDSLDSDEIRAYGGVTWDATAKTSGTAKLGWLTKDFRSPRREDYSGMGWEASLQWRPRTYSTLNLATRREPVESATGMADAVVIGAVDLDWIHYWKPRLHTKLRGMATDDDYYGTPRNDNRWLLSAGIYYQTRRWLEVGAEYRWESRDSNEPRAEYRDNIFALSLRSAY